MGQDQLFQHPVQTVGGVGVADEADEVVVILADGDGHDPLLASERIVDGALGDTRPLAQVAQGEPLEAAFDQQLARLAQDAAAALEHLGAGIGRALGRRGRQVVHGRWTSRARRSSKKARARRW